MSDLKGIWKDIPGYEGLYQANSLGKIRSMNYGKKKGYIKELTICKGSKYYSQVLLYKDGKRKSIGVHRLIAAAFLGLNLNNTKEFACHISEQTNHLGLLYNGVDNIWIGNCKENMIDCANKGRTSNQGKFGKNNHLSKQVKQIDLKGNLIKIWNGLCEIERNLGFSRASISRVCLGKQETSYGYKWKY